MKKDIIKVIVSLVIYISAIIGFEVLNIEQLDNEIIKICAYLLPFLIVGYEVIFKAIKNLIRGMLLDENFLMCIASIGAFVLGDYKEAVAVMLFYQIGELFQDYAVDKSRKSIASLMNIRPDYANIEKAGEIISVDPEDIKIGDIIIVKAGEKIPLDGEVIFGEASIDTMALTGEPVPRKASIGSEVISGCININGLLRIKVTKEFGESTVSKILELVENASSKKGEAEKFITKFARFYTPIVVSLAAALAVLPPLFTGDDFTAWISRAMVFLVISCPCALVISVPLSFFGGIGGASKLGILIKGSNYIENISKLDTILFDKTGTLTKGVFKVINIIPENGISKDKLLEIATYSENYSNHPISISLKESYEKSIDASRITDVEEIPGHGIKAKLDGKLVLAGNEKLMKLEKIEYKPCNEMGTLVYVVYENMFYGTIVIADELKKDAKLTIEQLKREGINNTVMLTGDQKAIAEKVAGELKIDKVYSRLLPADKVARVEEVLKENKEKGKVAFVGDGVNDAPVLMRVDVGIAMGGLGSDAAIEAADVVLMNDEPSKIVTAIMIAKKTMRIVKENIIFALTIKIGFLLLGAFGMANMWEAVFADVGVSVIAILNAMRCLKISKYK